MRHISVEPPPFFHRGPSPLARLAFFGLLSLALLFADTRYRYLESVRHAVAVVLYPVQRALQLPVKPWPRSPSSFSCEASPPKTNTALRRQFTRQVPPRQGSRWRRRKIPRLRPFPTP